jgi:hypothetical protein
MNWKHDKLAEDLAAHLSTPWLQVHLGSVWLERPQLADVITIQPSYTRFCLHIYEVKVSRADFLGDLRRDKWRGYLNHCHRLTFAVPAGMIKKEEVPREAGLIVRGPKGWQVQKAAPKMDIEIPDNTLLSMLFIKGRTTVRQRNLDAALGYSASYGDWDGKKRQARHLVKRIAKALRVHQELEETKMRYESANKYFASLVREALELEPDESYWPLWKVGDLVREIQRKAMERGDPIEHH